MTWMQLLPFVEAALLLPSSIVLAAYAVWYENGKEIIRSMNITIANMACEDSGDVPLFTAEQISVSSGRPPDAISKSISSPNKECFCSWAKTPKNHGRSMTQVQRFAS